MIEESSANGSDTDNGIIWGGPVTGFERLERRVAHLAALSLRYSWARLGIILAGVVLAFWMFSVAGEVAGWITIAVVLLGFGGVAHLHSRVERGIVRYRAWIAIRVENLARQSLEWSAIPQPTHRDVDVEHPFEHDLNVTGERSLLHLVDTSVSEGGSDRLRSWLLDQRPDPQIIDRRQQGVRELAGLDHFRERMRLTARLSGRGAGARWESGELMKWLEGGRPERALLRHLLVLTALAIVNITLVVLYVFDIAPLIWPASFVVYIAVYLFRREDFEDLFKEALHLQGALGKFSAVLLYLERPRFTHHKAVSHLCASFRHERHRPSLHLRRVSRIAAAAGAQGNPLLRLILNVAMPWDYYFAHRLNRVRLDVRNVLPTWLDSWYELEAICSLASFAWLHQGVTMPIIDTERPGEPLYDGEGLAHPLIHGDLRVANNFRTGRDTSITIITGSNMSGKSTFLRTLGTSLVLALAGGGVIALRLRIVPLRLHTCINVSDSVNDGISYFYAEVKRLKGLLDALQSDDSVPLFYLIDEIFRGTNNRERLIGSRSFIRALSGGNGVGAISTHDLELVPLAEEMPGGRNYHFREAIADGRMVFDYKLRSGPSPTTNALEIMRIEGLPVEQG